MCELGQTLRAGAYELLQTLRAEACELGQTLRAVACELGQTLIHLSVSMCLCGVDALGRAEVNTLCNMLERAVDWLSH